VIPEPSDRAGDESAESSPASSSPSASSGPSASPASSASSLSSTDSVIGALAEPTRRRLLDLLAEQGEATATALAARLPVSRQAIVKHLTVLEAAGLVSASRVGREVRYAVRPAALDATARWMSALAADWDRRLADIKRIAEDG